MVGVNDGYSVLSAVVYHESCIFLDINLDFS